MGTTKRAMLAKLKNHQSSHSFLCELCLKVMEHQIYFHARDRPEILNLNYISIVVVTTLKGNKNIFAREL